MYSQKLGVIKTTHKPLYIGMGKLAITISKEGIQTLSFLGFTEDERRLGLELYTILQGELRVIDSLIKQYYGKGGGIREREEH